MSVPDGVASSQADPLRDWAVLLLRLRKLLLRAECLVGLHVISLVFHGLHHSFISGGTYRHLDGAVPVLRWVMSTAAFLSSGGGDSASISH